MSRFQAGDPGADDTLLPTAKVCNVNRHIYCVDSTIPKKIAAPAEGGFSLIIKAKWLPAPSLALEFSYIQ